MGSMSIRQRIQAFAAIAGIVWTMTAWAGCTQTRSRKPPTGTVAPPPSATGTTPVQPSPAAAQPQPIPDPSLRNTATAPDAVAAGPAADDGRFATRRTDEAKYPVRFETNRKAIFRCGDKTADLPGTLWLDDRWAPGGEPRITFRPCIDGSFQFFYGDQQPCTFTDPSGTPLKVLRCSLELASDAEDENTLVTVYKLHLAR